ncbi:MAG TPA: hypothetical protein VJC21_02235 [Candidatus Nanoarchaeia archaeon]|nr:hypothetical protein [Candidatus Nanoarchaeia archaeon]
MNLQEMLKNVKYADKNVLIAEFSNGFAVAYERGTEQWARMGESGQAEQRSVTPGETFMKYALLPPSKGILCPGHNANYLDTQKWCSFSAAGKETIDVYLKRQQTPLTQENEKQRELYQQMIAPLEITEYTYTQWKEVGQGLLMGIAGWPMLIYCSVTGKKSASGDPELAMLFAPIGFVYAGQELVKPSGKAKKIKNKELLRKENTGENPAMWIGGNSPDRFRSLDLLFPSGVMLRSFGADKSQNEFEDESYKNAEHFLPVEPRLRDKVYASFAKTEQIWNQWRAFGEMLQPENQTALLRSLGFYGDPDEST